MKNLAILSVLIISLFLGGKKGKEGERLRGGVCKEAESKSSDRFSVVAENKYSRRDSLKQATLTKINIYLLRVNPFPKQKQQIF